MAQPLQQVYLGMGNPNGGGEMEKISRRHIRMPNELWAGLGVLARGNGRSLNNYLVEVVLRPHVESRPIVSLSLNQEAQRIINEFSE